MSATMRISELASRMGCCAAHARKTALRLHRQNPGLGIVTRPSGATTGRIEVSRIALALIQQQTAAEAIDELSVRVGLAESDIQTFRARMAHVEKRVRMLETCSKSSG